MTQYEPITAASRAVDLTVAAPYIAASRRLAGMVVGLESIGLLYDRLASSFELRSDQLKRFVLDGFAEHTSWTAALNVLRPVLRLHPQNVPLRDEMSLLLEQSGRVEDALHERQAIDRMAPSLSNCLALGRIYELAGTDKSIKEYYGRLFRTQGPFLLALSRHMATAGVSDVDGISLANLRGRVLGALDHSPGSVSLHLAAGFIGVASGDLALATMNFLRASVLAEHPVAVAESASQADPTDIEYDPWCMNYAQAFLLDLLPPDRSRGAMFTPIDSFQLALVRAGLLRKQGATFPALEQYGTATSQLLGAPPTRRHQIYKGYRIVLHERRFYAVPTSVQNFSIHRGVVIRIPGFIDEVKPLLTQRMSPGWRAAARPVWHFIRRRGLPRLRRNPILRFIGRRIYMLWMWLYARFWTVSGVLIESDVVLLRDRIDHS